jgi:hypothetical protein
VNRAKQLSKQLLMGAGALALVALLMNLVAPKAVHATVAALVQVANTPTNPVPTADLTISASQIVAVYCIPGSNCNAVEPGGGMNSQVSYTVPAGQNLVITSLEITTPSVGGASSFFIAAVTFDPIGVDQAFFVANDGTTHEFVLPRGIVWPAGGVLSTFASNIGLRAVLRGYLTPN